MCRERLRRLRISFLTLSVFAFLAPATIEAGAISTTSAKLSYPAPNFRQITGTGNIFLGYGETFVKVEMLVLRIDGAISTVPAQRNGSTWTGGYQ